MNAPLDPRTPVTTSSENALRYITGMAETGAVLCMVPIMVGTEMPTDTGGGEAAIVLALLVDDVRDPNSFVLKISADGTWMCMLLAPDELLQKH